MCERRTGGTSNECFSFGEPSLTDLPKGKIFNVKITGEVCGVWSF